MSDTNFTPGPWTPYNLVDQAGKEMTPEQIGEYVTEMVKKSPETRFLFVEAEKDGVELDVCHVGNGPAGPWNAQLIASAPELYEVLSKAVSRLKMDMDDGSRPDYWSMEAIVEPAIKVLAKARGETE